MTFEEWWDSDDAHPECSISNYDACKAAYEAGIKRAAEHVLECAQGGIPIQPSFTYRGISNSVLGLIKENV